MKDYTHKTEVSGSNPEWPTIVLKARSICPVIFCRMNHLTNRYITDNIAQSIITNDQMADTPRAKTRGKPSRFSRHPEPGCTVRGRVWLENDGELYLGGGRVMLLERVGKFGSIAAAARSMGLSYRNAWLWIEAANRLAPAPLVEKTPGGVHGGGARLTKEGQKAVNRYHQLRDKFEKFLEQMQ